MYRFLLTPRWWGINVFAALAIPFCLFMGSWQLGRFEERVDSHEEQQRTAVAEARKAAEPLTELLPVTKETSGRLATATGRYDTQLLVPDRRLDDRNGFYVLTLLRTGDGPALPVVRGWLPGDARTADAPAPPPGEVTVTGALQAPENQGTPGARPGGGLPEGQVGMISAASLVNIVPYDVHSAWVTLSDGDAGLRSVPPAAAEGSGLDLKAFQNLGYTAEWFVFAGFVLFMWFRLFRGETEAARDRALGLLPEDGPGGEPAPAPVPGPGKPGAPDTVRGGPRPGPGPGLGAEPAPEEGAGPAAERVAGPGVERDAESGVELHAEAGAKRVAGAARERVAGAGEET
ncbi:SURF1 family protein [Streptomyces sp. NPDC048845]|uniref:SURF1 family protein n=1 Tax=Streptomyces sp. NPDC048845 TaxID=3155390 RepID=UPI003439DA30